MELVLFEAKPMHVALLRLAWLQPEHESRAARRDHQ
jgi:hypothetical protein